jgi:aspartyl/asparaginyl beta-hydroxylase (cupin superfamily)
MEIVTISTIKQPPGNIIPLHRDTFFQINQRFPDRKELKVRTNIYLEDYKIGQFLQYEMEDSYHNSTHWKQGDGYMWDSQHLHLSANAGLEDKYTLQISGFYLGDTNG